MGILGSGAKLLKSKVAKAGAKRAVKEGVEGAVEKKAAAEAAEKAASMEFRKSLTDTRKTFTTATKNLATSDVWDKGILKFVPTGIGVGVGAIIIGAGVLIGNGLGLTGPDGVIPNEYETLFIYGTGTIIVVYLLKSISEVIRARNETKLIDAREERLMKAIPPMKPLTPAVV